MQKPTNYKLKRVGEKTVAECPVRICSHRQQSPTHRNGERGQLEVDEPCARVALESPVRNDGAHEVLPKRLRVLLITRRKVYLKSPLNNPVLSCRATVQTEELGARRQRGHDCGIHRWGNQDKLKTCAKMQKQKQTVAHDKFGRRPVRRVNAQPWQLWI